MTRDILVTWFVKNYPENYNLMNKTFHEFSTDNMSPWHGEGSVWTHTMMVMTYIEYLNINQFDKDILLTTGLLHDIGKPYAIEFIPSNGDKPDRYMFRGHEGISTFHAIKILKHLECDFPDTYKDIINDILNVISLHGVSLEETTTSRYNSMILSLRKQFMEADKAGAIRMNSGEKSEHYPPRKFLRLPKSLNKEVVIMCGLPCSGKSTYIAENFSDYSIISRDEEIMRFYQLHNEISDYNTSYNWVHNNEDTLELFNKSFNDIIRSVSKHDKVVVDMTMLSLSSRRSMLSNFNQHTRKVVVMMTPLDELYRRNNQRDGKYIPEHVLSRMMTQFVMPVESEGFCDIEIVLN